MPIATNPDTGESVYLDNSGQWVPAPVAKNPQTGESLIFDGQDWKPKVAKPEGYGMAGGLVDAAAQGIPIVGPLLQKAGAAGAAAIQPLMSGFEDTSFGQRYGANLKALQGRTEQFSKENPVLSTTAGIAGGIGATLPLATTSMGAKALGLVGNTLPKQIAAGAASGAAIGGTDAALRGSDPFMGAGVGSMIGGAAPVAGRAIGGVYRGIRNAVSPEANVAADLGRALMRDSETPVGLATKFADAASERPGVATLADAGGENVKGLVERVAQTPGAGRTTVVPALTGRQQGQMARLVGDLSQLTGTTKTAQQAVEQTIAARKQAAAPLYDQAMQFDVASSPELANTFMEAISTGWGKAIVNSPGFKRTLQTEYGLKGQPGPEVMMRVIDAWKKHADDLVSEAMRAGNNNKARVIGQMRDRVIAAADTANPGYAAARDAWAGPSKFLDAIEEGRNILSPKMGAEEMAAKFASLTTSEKEAYRIGAVSAIRGKMGGDSAKLGNMTKYISSPEAKAKIAVLMPDQQSADKWLKRLDFEVGASELTNRSLGNSATARRLAERADANNIAGDLAMDVLAGAPTASLWRRAITAVPTKIRDTMRSKADAKLADVLVNPNAKAADLLRILSGVQNAPAMTQRTNNAFTAAIRGPQPYLTD